MTNTCKLCARDCSGIPHVRDKSGRCVCEACCRTVNAGRSPQSAPDHDAEAIELEPDQPSSRGVCPSCFRPLPPDTGRCVSCSSELRLSARPDISIPTCQKCGYDLTGAKSLICPECGTTQRPRPKNHNLSHHVVRDAYLKPVIATVCGLAAVVLFLVAYGSPESIPSTLLAILVQSAVGLAIFWVCSLIWIGFDEPFHFNALRLLAIYSISWTVLLLTLAIPFVCFPALLAPAILFVLLHKKMLDLDFPDAALVATITGIVWIAVYLVILGKTYL